MSVLLGNEGTAGAEAYSTDLESLSGGGRDVLMSHGSSVGALELPLDPYFEGLYTDDAYFQSEMLDTGWPGNEPWEVEAGKAAANRALVGMLSGTSGEEDDDLAYEVRRQAIGQAIYGKAGLGEEDFFNETRRQYSELRAELGKMPEWYQPNDVVEYPELAQRAYFIEVGKAYAENAAKRSGRPVAPLDEDKLVEIGRQAEELEKRSAPDDVAKATTAEGKLEEALKLIGGGVADGTLTIGEGFYNQYAQILRRSFPESEWALLTAEEAERLSGEFDQLRAAYAQAYKVNEEMANSFTGRLLTGAGELVPQTAVSLLPGVGIVALQSQNFQYAWEDAERAARESGQPLDPDRAFMYAETMAFTQAVLDKVMVGRGVKPWMRGGSRSMRTTLMRIFRSGVEGGITNMGQGALADAEATAFGIEERNPFDPERRGTDFLLGFGTTGALSGTSAGLGGAGRMAKRGFAEWRAAQLAKRGGEGKRLSGLEGIGYNKESQADHDGEHRTPDHEASQRGGVEPDVQSVEGLGNTTRFGDVGVFSKIIAGRIKGSEMKQIVRVLERQHGTEVVYNSPLAKEGSFFNPEVNQIHFQGGSGQQRRGLFYEEIQHAFDFHAGAYMGVVDNRKLHSITAKNLVENPLLPTTEQQNHLLLKLAQEWK